MPLNATIGLKHVRNRSGLPVTTHSVPIARGRKKGGGGKGGGGGEASYSTQRPTVHRRRDRPGGAVFQRSPAGCIRENTACVRWALCTVGIWGPLACGSSFLPVSCGRISMGSGGETLHFVPFFLLATTTFMGGGEALPNFAFGDAPAG